jgi:hypothetical protein
MALTSAVPAKLRPINIPSARPRRLRSPPPNRKPAPAENASARKGRRRTFDASRSSSVNGRDSIAVLMSLAQVVARADYNDTCLSTFAAT